MGYQEFLNKLQRRGSNKYKIAHCLGARDAWLWVRRNKWIPLKGNKCSEQLYSEIVSSINLLLVEQLLEGHTIEFPHQMGHLQLISVSPKLKNSNGKYINNYRVDWKKTLDYWYHDEEARKKKQVVKRIQNNIYSIIYSKEGAKYKNQRYYCFRANRSLVRKLGRCIENGRVTALNK